MFALVVACAARVEAQQPARLPAVVVNAAPDPPGPRKIAGIVRDTSAIPIDSVEVSIVSLQLRTFSKSDGNFRFENVKPGTYDVRARKLGYAPQIKSMVVDSMGATGAFALLPLPHVLRPFVTTVGRGGLSGVVGDTAFNALVGAEVRVLGHGHVTKTDSMGAFYFALRPGSYVVNFKQPGFANRLVSVIVPPDSGERITVNLAPPSRPLSLRQVHNVDDLNSRLAWRSHSHSRVYTNPELKQMKIEWVYDAVRKGFNEIYTGPNGWVDTDCAVIANGGPDIRLLANLTVDDIESVEIYDTKSGPPPPPRPTTRRTTRPFGAQVPTLQPGISHVPMSNTELASWANFTKSCPMVYVWLR
jgi:hypothetical protein